MSAQIFGQYSRDKATLVFQPGGTAGGNVYTSWASLYAAISTVSQGPIVISVDSSLGAATIPAGAYTLTDVRFHGARSNGDLLTVASGVTWTGVREFQDLTVAFQNNATVETISTVAGGQLRFIRCVLNMVGSSAAVWAMTNGSFSAAIFQGGNILNSTTPIFSVALGTTAFPIFQLFAAPNGVPVGMFTGAGAVLAQSDGTVAIPTFTGIGSQSLFTSVHNIYGWLQQVSPAPAPVAAGTVSFDFSTANEFILQSGTSTITLANVPEGSTGYLVVKNAGSPSALTWATTIKWPGATPPTSSSNDDLYRFIKIGGLIYGTVALNLS